MKKIIAIIPARGGSKRIPRKNIKLFAGQPIIKYSIDAALGSKIFDKVMVSTDDKEIADTAKKYGAVVPFLRSEKNSNDTAVIADVIEEVLLEYKKIGEEFDYACCIYPTAPFVKIENLKRGFETISQADADSLVSIAKFSYPIQRALKVEKDGGVKMILPENFNKRSQDLMPAYHDAGQFFFVNVERFLQHKKTLTEKTVHIVIPESEVQDIDTLEDWKIAEIKYEMLHGQKKQEA